MNHFIGNHAPTPEFRASLEREIVSTFRREAQFAPPSRFGRGHPSAGRMRSAIALAAGLVIGVAMAVASTRVADARQREEIASTTRAKRELAAVQLDLSRANYDQVRRAFEKGATTDAARLSAEAELHANEARVARLELDLEESRRSALPPRDELWAPLVGGRDFVKERLDIEAAAAQRRLASLEASAVDAERAFRAGVLTQPAMADAQSEVLQARRDVDAVSRKLSLRKLFLDEHLAPDEVARRLQRFELMTDVDRAEQLLRLAEDRLSLARERSRRGGAVDAKAKKAEVAVMEHSVELEQLRVTSARTALTYGASEPQQGIPLVDLPAASARTAEPVGALLGIREVSGGKVLVNDGTNRQLKVFDSTLASAVIALDSTPGVPNRYGARVPLVRYLGDSSLLPDVMSRSVRVLDARGQVARTVALPNAPFDLSAPSYADDRGRVFYMSKPDTTAQSHANDSTSILRVDLETQRVDTVGRVRRSAGSWFNYWMTGSPPTIGGLWFARPAAYSYAQDLVPNRDDWAVLSSGALALVRGHDYHIDWVDANGRLSSSAPLALDWKRPAEAAPAPLDSALWEKFAIRARGGDIVAGRGRVGGAGGARGGGAGVVLPDSARFNASVMLYRLAVLRVAGLSLESSATSSDAAIPDLDGNVWILPTVPARAESARLVYDVVNAKGQLVERVRLPAGRSVAGFGKGGVVYLLASAGLNQFSLERTRLVGGPKGGR